MMSRNQKGEERMKSIIEFNLDEERAEFDFAVNGSKYHSVIWDLDNHLRGLTKYPPDNQSEDTYNALQETRDKLHQLLNEYNLEV
jgi:hypothetical protein